MSTPQPQYHRIVLKISGEGFCPPGGFGLHREPLDRVAAEIADVAKLGVQVGVVCGGGNFLRGARFADELGIDRATADYMGMLGTVLNALALQEALERFGQPARVQSALAIARVGEPFDRQRCLRHLESGRVVLLAAGTGNPHVTTDSCAAMRAIELRADILLKGTKVDGVYTADPHRDANAKLYEYVTYDEVIHGRLRVMDISATDLCEQYNLPAIVFNLFDHGALRRVVLGETLGTRMGPPR
ncbi:MAG: UMP kinase [Phycisphaerales bacterium]|nr:UMP kinase [Phycisphaerales bacterium]